MTIEVRPVGDYKDVTIRHDNDVTIALGLMDADEALEFATTLKEAIWDLLEEKEYYQLIEEDVR